MDQEKNKGFYDIIKTMYGGCKKIHDTESAGCINSVFKDHGTTIDEYDPAIDYHKIFDGIVKEAQDMAEAEYAAGFDREGKKPQRNLARAYTVCKTAKAYPTEI